MKFMSKNGQHYSGKFKNEFLACIACYSTPSAGGDRQRMWIGTYRFDTDRFGLGSRRSGSFDHFKQPKKLI